MSNNVVGVYELQEVGHLFFTNGGNPEYVDMLMTEIASDVT